VFAFEIDKTIDIDFIEGNAPDGITEDNACEECGYEDCDFRLLVEELG